MDSETETATAQPQSPLSKVLANLREVHATGDDSFEAICPAHEDGTPSLSLKETDSGDVLLHCHAGCSIADVVKAIGLSMADLFAAPKANGQAAGKRVVATYDYQDEAGQLLFQVVRFEPKDFRQRHRAGPGEKATREGWSWTTKGLRKVPYRLPEVRAAVAAAGRIWIVEGEKDADGLAAIGLCATCNAGGAGKWRSECTDAFKGAADVVIIPDNDAPGRGHARKVLKALRGVKIQARILELCGPGKDASDWIQSGGTAEELERLASAVPTPSSDVADGPNKDADSDRHLTDTWLAEQVIDRHGSDLRYIGAWGKWLTWDGLRWELDDTGEVQRRIKATLRALLVEAAKVWDIDLVDFAVKAEAEARRTATLSLARFETAVVTRYQDLDREPWLLNIQNGTANLRTGEIRPHQREDILTKLAPVRFDKTAVCPLWEQFLLTIMAGDAELVGFLQRAIGYSLTGDVSEQVLFFAHGVGANGKSTLARVLLALTGDYGKQAAPGLLLAKRGEAHPTEQADLFGARLVVSQEVEQGRALAEVTVKQLTGGDKIKARRMREDFWEFDPSHKLWLCANHKPIIRGTDHAIWRRIMLIPFAVTIPEGERDKHLPEKLMAELPGILNWAIRGCLAWQRDGLQPPKKVLAASAEYRAEMDLIGDFLAERCVQGAGVQVRARELFAAFKLWAEDSGERVISQKLLGMNLAERPGLSKTKSHGSIIWHGVGLREDPEGGDPVPPPGCGGEDNGDGRSVSPATSPETGLRQGDPDGRSLPPPAPPEGVGGNSPAGNLAGDDGEEQISFPGSSPGKTSPADDPKKASLPPHHPPKAAADSPATGAETPARDSPLTVLPIPAYVVVTDASKVEALAEQVAKAEFVALDLETTGLEPLLSKPRLLQLALPDGTAYLLDLFALGSLGALSGALGKPILVGHNLQFDLAFLAAHFGFEAARLFDTMIASKLIGGGIDLHTKGAHTLAKLVRTYLSHELPKDEQTSDWSGALTTEQLAYAARDVAGLLALRKVLVDRLVTRGLVRVAKLEFDVLPAVVAMELAGVGLDVVAWQHLLSNRKAAADKLHDEVKAALGVENPDSTKQVLAALQRIGIPVTSTSSDALSLHSDSAVVQLLQRYRGLTGFVARGPALLEAAAVHGDGRIRAQFDQLAAPTGRFGCSAPNLQALPKEHDVRACIVPAPGCVFVVADYAAIELRVLASLARDPRLIDTFKNGGDPHKQTASLVSGKPAADITDDERRRAKAVNFGFAFGMGAKRFVTYAREDYKVNFTLGEANRFREAYLRSYVGIARWHRSAAQYKPMEVRTASGRFRKFSSRDTGFTERLNTPVQGTAADGLKQAIILLRSRLPVFGARIVLCVHDELVVEAPPERAEEVKSVVERSMIEGMATFVGDVPIAVEADVRSTWAKDGKG